MSDPAPPESAPGRLMIDLTALADNWRMLAIRAARRAVALHRLAEGGERFEAEPAHAGVEMQGAGTGSSARFCQA